MKKLLALLVMTVNAFAVEKKELMPLIEEASTKRESAYVEVRKKIVDYGKDAIPILGDIAVDESLPWQQRLVARICYERIEREKEIKKILEIDWYSHPKIDSNWPDLIIGQEGYIAGLVKAEIAETGLWYYCLELEWKMTNERGNLRERGGNSYWTSACIAAVRDNPEERIWFLRICSEIMVIDPPTQRWSNWLFPTLRREEKPDTAYLLEHRAPPSVPEEPPFRLGTKIIKLAKQP